MKNFITIDKPICLAFFQLLQVVFLVTNTLTDNLTDKEASDFPDIQKSS